MAVHNHTKVVAFMASGMVFGGFLAMDHRAEAQSLLPDAGASEAEITSSTWNDNANVCGDGVVKALEGWVTLDTTGADEPARVVISVSDHIVLAREGSRFVAEVRTDQRPEGHTVRSNRPVATGSKQHVAVVARPGDSLRIYVDGMLAGATLIDGDVLRNKDAAAPTATLSTHCEALGAQRIATLARNDRSQGNQLAVMVGAL
ncbi:MAG: LamG-like jellyroll fold domain-containing protein [Pseudomonadota bacterium]